VRLGSIALVLRANGPQASGGLVKPPDRQQRAATHDRWIMVPVAWHPTPGGLMMEDGLHLFDWHRDPIMRDTPITSSYRNTQNVRRFFQSQCGAHFRFNTAFMAWLKDPTPKTMGDAVDEWQRRQRTAG
jgi:hypothetical protein